MTLQSNRKNNLIFTMGLTSYYWHQDNVASYRPITNVLITKGNTIIELKEANQRFLMAEKVNKIKYLTSFIGDQDSHMRTFAANAA